MIRSQICAFVVKTSSDDGVEVAQQGLFLLFFSMSLYKSIFVFSGVKRLGFKVVFVIVYQESRTAPPRGRSQFVQYVLVFFVVLEF